MDYTLSWVQVSSLQIHIQKKMNLDDGKILVSMREQLSHLSSKLEPEVETWSLFA